MSPMVLLAIGLASGWATTIVVALCIIFQQEARERDLRKVIEICNNTLSHKNSELQLAQHNFEVCINDMHEAASDLNVAAPTPGTDAARLLVAYAAMKRKLEKIRLLTW